MRFMTAALVLAAVPAMAQDPPVRTWWGFVSLGAASAVDSGFYASGVGVAFQRRSKLTMLRIASLDTPKKKRIEDFGVLIGVARQPRFLQIAVAAGLGVATDSRDSTALALPVEAQVTLIVARPVAVGVRAFGSVNRLTNFGGVGLTLQLGRLR